MKLLDKSRRLLDNKPLPGVVAWTGGTTPRKPSEVTPLEAGVEKYLFQEQVETFRGYWGQSPDWDTLRIFFNRARHDAHSTFRNLTARQIAQGGGK